MGVGKHENESKRGRPGRLTGVQVAAPAFEYVPIGHVMQVAADVAPALFEEVPAGHSVQDPAPEAEYVPVPH